MTERYLKMDFEKDGRNRETTKKYHLCQKEKGRKALLKEWVEECLRTRIVV